jgi:hypothetical protein
MREANNGFLLNGAAVQESGFGGTTGCVIATMGVSRICGGFLL